MLQNVNLEEVRQYNNNLKVYKDKAANLNAEIEYTNKEIDALCAELTAELGKQVTRDNIEQIYNEQVESINSTLQSGNAVLSKIASEEQGTVQQTVNVQPTPIMTPPVAPTPVAPAPVAPTPVQGSVFNGQAATMPGQTTNSLPPMFSI